MYKINVLIICYKQEALIGRAIDSVLRQKEYGLNKIIIQDDCSPDGTWKVIEKYQSNHPNLIDAYRNEQNLGIYGNLESLIDKRGDADIIGLLSGDDVYCDGWFKKIQHHLKENNIDLCNKAATILSDFKTIKPNGLSLINTNNRYVEKDTDLVSLKIRGIISARSTLTTKHAYDRYKPLIIDEGLGLAEAMADLRPFLYSDEFYYVPFVATAYYGGIGISTKLGGKEYFEERINYYKRAKELFPINIKAKFWMDFLISRRKYEIDPSFKHYICLFKPYIKSVDKYNRHTIVSHLLMFARLLKKLFQRGENASREM